MANIDDYEEINGMSFDEMKTLHKLSLQTVLKQANSIREQAASIREQTIMLREQSEAINNLTKFLGI